MRHKLGIVWKYFLAYSVTTTLVISVLSLLISGVVEDRYEKKVEDELTNYAILASETFCDLSEIDPEFLNERVKSVGAKIGARITLIAPDGTVLADSERNYAEMENHSGRPEVQKALAGGIGKSRRYSTTVKKTMNYVAIPIKDGEEVKMIVRVSLWAEDTKLLIGGINRRIALLSLVIWGCALGLTFLFSSVFSASVRRVVGLTRRLASGDFSARATLSSRDELGDLSRALNEMAEKLQSLFSQLTAQHEELDAIINSMSEGVLVLDRHMRVTLANGSFREMFNLTSPIEGKTVMEVIRSADLKLATDELIKSGTLCGHRMRYGEKVLLISGSDLKPQRQRWDSFVLVFHDITADVEIERIKADFVANASHELRTPLAAIRGYLEAIEDEDPDTQKRFIEIINRNIERMSSLISDLLLLSRLESDENNMSIEQVDLNDLIGDVIRLISKQAREKGIEVRTELESRLIIRGDSFLLEQALLNLLDNAVKYTDKGSITVLGARADDKVKVDVIDTGVGIPAEHIPRIFERFYRVDKARSRQMGGTGLGLSIVKHTVQLHKGEIKVSSEPGKGTTFTLLLPASESVSEDDTSNPNNIGVDNE